MKLLKNEVVPRPSGVSGKRRKDWVRLGEHQHQGAVDGAVCVPGSCGCWDDMNFVAISFA